MKRLFGSLIVLLALSTSLVAQMPQIPPIPADKDVRVGKLDNGLTYYIRHNAKPEKQGEFYIYNDVGAIQEEDSQVGLAHFLEHMAFNGTKHFPGNNLKNYLETIGVKFGANLNAGTGQDMTVYNMSSVPLLREGIIDSVLLILHDWSYFISLLPEEIDKERGVIIEELRTGNDASFRINEKTSKTLYSNTKYAYRNIIGNEEQLRTFSYDELRNFYHRWYRTDLQTLVIVGDFDVDVMEAKVRKVMADIPRVENPEPKVPVIVPDNEDPLVAVATDPEQPRTQFEIYIKREPLPRELKNTIIAVSSDYAYDMICGIINNRFNDITQKPNSPFISARVMQGEMHPTMDVILVRGVARDGEATKAFEAVYAELEKAQRFGFTPSEFDRVKSDMMRSAQMSYDNRNDRRSQEFIWTYIGNFRGNSAMPDAVTDWKNDSTVLANMSVSLLNMAAPQAITDQNQVVIIAAPQKEGSTVPSEADILAIIKKVRAEELTGYEDSGVKEPLVTEALKGSKVKKTSTDKFGATIWTLANGINVVVKPTDFKADEVRIRLDSYGGLSQLPDGYFPTAPLLAEFVRMSGVGKFSATDLEKQLAGKAVKYTPTISQYKNGFSGSCSPKDLETLFQLSYLYIAAPRFNADDFTVMVDRYRASLANLESSPNYQLGKNLQKTLYGDNPRMRMMDTEMLGQLKFETMEKAYRQMFSNGADFSVVITGNVKFEELQPLVEKYLGSLPVAKKKMSWKDDKVAPVKGMVTNRFSIPMEAPKSSVVLVYNGDEKYDLENTMIYSILDQILDIRCTESVREEKGGTYGVMVQAKLNEVPEGSYEVLIYFDTDPKMSDELTEVVREEMRKLAENGPLAEDLSKVKEYMTKQRADDLKKNPTWIGILDSYYVSHIDTYEGYDEILAGIDAARIKAVAAKILKDGNLATVVMEPAAKSE